MEIVTIVSRKGGCGKTATAHALGAGLIRKGYSVLYVDLDSQANLSYALGADRSGLNSMDLLTGEATAQEAIKHTPQGDIITGAAALDAAAITITGTRKEYKLKDALQPLEGIYNYVIIDTPTALGTLTINALTAANSAVITVLPDAFSMEGLVQLNNTLNTIKKHCNPDLAINGLLITRYKGRTNLSKGMRSNFEGAAAALNTRLYSLPIRESNKVGEAQAEQTDILAYAPKAEVAKEYSNFIDEFLKG